MTVDALVSTNCARACGGISLMLNNVPTYLVLAHTLLDMLASNVPAASTWYLVPGLAAAGAQTCVADAVHLAFAKRTPHVPWRFFPQTLDGWFVKSGGPGVWSGTAVQRLAAAQGMVCLQLCVWSVCSCCVRHFSEVRFKRKFPKKDKFSPKSVLSLK